MVAGLFDLEDVRGGRDALGAVEGARLWARARLGEAPLAAAAELAARGDPEAAAMLSGAAAFAGPDELGALAQHAVGVDGLCAVVLAPWIAPASRVAAAEALGQGEALPASLAALGHLADGDKKPPWAQASRALAALVVRATPEARREADRIREAARHVRDGVQGELRRQRYLREVASGGIHPVVGSLVGDTGAFFAGLLPPIEDIARTALVPFLVTVLRGPSEPARQRVLAMFQRRWREPAGPSLSAIARTSLRGREASLGPMVVRALDSLGALDGLAAALGCAPGPVRVAALGALESLSPRTLADCEPTLLDAALHRAVTDPDGALADRARALQEAALTVRAGA